MADTYDRDQHAERIAVLVNRLANELAAFFPDVPFQLFADAIAHAADQAAGIDSVPGEYGMLWHPVPRTR
jgi:hypothetical protein